MYTHTDVCEDTLLQRMRQAGRPALRTLNQGLEAVSVVGLPRKDSCEKGVFLKQTAVTLPCARPPHISQAARDVLSVPRAIALPLYLLKNTRIIARNHYSQIPPRKVLYAGVKSTQNGPSWAI